MNKKVISVSHSQGKWYKVSFSHIDGTQIELEESAQNCRGKSYGFPESEKKVVVKVKVSLLYLQFGELLLYPGALGEVTQVVL